MTLQEYEKCQRGDKLYYARVMPRFGYYEIHDVVMVTKHDTYCSACEIKTKQSFLFNVKESGICNLFLNREKALKYLKDEKRKNKDVKLYVTKEDWR